MELKTILGVLLLILSVGSVHALSPPCGQYGDVDGDGVLTKEDHTLASHIIMEPGNGTYEQRLAVNVDGDGDLDVDDSILIASYLVGSITDFPVCEQAARPPCFRFGDLDLDGVITIYDANLAGAILSGNVEASEKQEHSLDVNGNHEVDVEDSMILASYLMGIYDTFPVCVMRNK